MHLIAGEYYHIYNRGNNRQPIFFSNDNYIFFIAKIRKQLAPVADIICYCLMPNHFHLIIKATDKSVAERNSFGGKAMQEFAYRVGVLLSSYSQAINKQRKTTGSLFQQKTKAKLLSEQVANKKVNYLESCFFYIHNNPLRSKLVTDLKDWAFSSWPDYAGIRNGTLCNKHDFFDTTGLIEKDVFNQQLQNNPLEMVEKFY
jgi:putative transposase